MKVLRSVAVREFLMGCSTVVLLFVALPAACVWAQQPAPQASAGDFGLLIPTAGAMRPGDGRRVLVAKPAGETVALVHVDLGDHRLLIMPNGRMESVSMSQTKPTEKTFLPATNEQLSNEMINGTFRGFKTKNTARYLYVYNTSQEFYKATSVILETMYPGVFAYFKRIKIPVHDPASPLVVIMFKTEAEFQKYHRMPSGVVAYYSAVSNHIVMYEESRLMAVAPELAMSQSISTIAHEGIHQILHNIGVQQRLSHWPIWISEGLAEYFAPTSTGKRLHWKGVGKINDLRMYELERFLKRGSTDSGEMVQQTVGAGGLTSTGYAAAWALTHYLAERKTEKFHAYLADVSQSVPFAERNDSTKTPSAESNTATFTKYFGSDFKTIEADLIKHLQKQPYTNPLAR